MIVFNVYNARGDDLEFRSPGVGGILGRLIPFTGNAMYVHCRIEIAYVPSKVPAIIYNLR
jgi:hypothetical protein